MGRIFENNQVTVSGIIEENFVFNHEVYREKFFKTHLAVKRDSGTVDSVPVIVSERTVNVHDEWSGRNAKVEGSFRSYNRHEPDGKHKLILAVYANEFTPLKYEGEEYIPDDENEIILDGCICKEVICRETPLGREISDVLLAVNRPYGKSDYIPCICWGRNARFVLEMNVGKRIKINGRIQSREYQKKIEEEYVTMTAYEVSVGLVEEVEEEE